MILANRIVWVLALLSIYTALITRTWYALGVCDLADNMNHLIYSKPACVVGVFKSGEAY